MSESRRYLVSDHWPEIESEARLAKAGPVVRRNGKPVFASIETMEKVPRRARLVATTGISGHGSRPMRTNAILHLSSRRC